MPSAQLVNTGMQNVLVNKDGSFFQMDTTANESQQQKEMHVKIKDLTAMPMLNVLKTSMEDGNVNAKTDLWEMVKIAECTMTLWMNARSKETSVMKTHIA